MLITYTTAAGSITVDGGCFATLEQSVAAGWREHAHVLPHPALPITALCHNRRQHATPDEVIDLPDESFVATVLEPVDEVDWVPA